MPKINDNKDASAPPVTVQPSPENEVPDCLKQFEGKTPQEIFAEHGVSPEQTEALAGLVFGFIGEWGGVLIPEFAKQASKQFWKYFLRKGFNPQENMEDAGVASRLLELMAEDSGTKPKPEFVEMAVSKAKPIAEMMEKAARAMPADETAKFYIGRALAEKTFKKIRNPEYLKMVKRAPLYIAIAAAWRQFEIFKSQAEAERWVRSQKIIGENFSSNEARAVFRIVGLRYRGQGRPKKSENARSLSDEIRI